MKKLLPVPLLVLILLVSSCMTATDNQITAEASDGAVVMPEEPAETEIAGTELSQVNEPAPKDESGKNSAVEAEVTGSTEEQSLPEPLGEAEFSKEIFRLMPWNMAVVYEGHSPMIIMHDLDKNGFKDALLVAVEGGDESETRLEELSKSARLFQSDQDFVNFLLLIFYQNKDGVVLRYTVPVSRQLVFNGVKPVEIKKGSDFPYALMFSFRTRSGIEKEMIILSGSGITHFTIIDSLSEITMLDDIDDDGFMDIIVHEQGLEEGTGFETFLTWYKWNLREYTEYKTTNIVRNLRQFFLVCAEYLRAGELRAFLEYAVEPEVLSELENSGLDDVGILRKIFVPVEADSAEDGLFSDKGLSTVVFPEIMETPFSYANRMDFRHQVSVRFGRTGEKSRVFLAELKMKKNPFQSRQFCFDINDY